MSNPFLHLLDLADLETFKKAFQALLKVHHPDKGGETRMMQFLNDVRERFVSGRVTTNRRKRQEYEDSDKFKGTRTTPAQASEWDAKLREAIYKILDLEDVTLELIGTWLWIEGEVSNHEELFKSYGFRQQVKGGVERYYYGETYGKPSKRYGRVPQHIIKDRYGVRNFEKEGKGLVKA